MSSVTDAVRRLLEREGLLDSSARLICAVSGGGDSVALLRALTRLQKETGFALIALHIQHGLRGEASLEDEAFVRSLCGEWQVPLVVKNARLTGDMTSPGAETRAREERRHLFLEAMNGADALLTAHHRDDQAETVLMHLLRGSGMDGLSGMKPAVPFGGGKLLRPLLELSKKELLSFLREEGIPYRTDESNLSPDTPRNALRLNVLPRLEEIFPGCGERLATAAEALSRDGEALNAQAEALLTPRLITAPGLHALLPLPEDTPEALARRVLRLFYERSFSTPPEERGLSHGDTLALTELYRRGEGEMNLPQNRKALMGRFALYLTPQNGPPPKSVPGFSPVELKGTEETLLLPAGEVDVTYFVEPPLPADPFTAVVPSGKQTVFRLPGPKDVIRPLGAPGHKPLRRYYTDLRLDAPLRSALPILAEGDTVLWVPGLCTSEELRCRGGSGILLTYRGKIIIKKGE